MRACRIGDDPVEMSWNSYSPVGKKHLGACRRLVPRGVPPADGYAREHAVSARTCTRTRSLAHAGMLARYFAGVIRAEEGSIAELDAMTVFFWPFFGAHTCKHVLLAMRRGTGWERSRPRQSL